jgi:predicted transcriptional regulator
MIRTQISLSSEQAERLRRLAAVRERSQASLLREAVDLLYDSDERLAAIDRARQPIGAYSSGHRDTADRHDDVLDEAFRT